VVSIKGFLKKRSIFVTFLVSHLLIIILAIIVGYIGYREYNMVIKKQVESYNIAMLEQAQKVLDERIAGIKKTIVNVGTDLEIQRLLYSGYELDGNDRFNISRAITNLSRYKGTDSFIYNIYVALNNSNTIITNTKSTNFENFYKQDSIYSQWSFNEWKKKLTEKYYMEFKPVQKVTTSEEEEQLITVFQSIPFGNVDGSLGCVVVSIDSNKIKELLKDINILNKGTVYITDDKNQIILSTGSNELLDSVKELNFSINSGFLYKKVQGTEVIISSVASSANGWRYVSVIPTKYVMQEINSIRNLTLILFLVSLSGAIALAYFLARKNFNPIRKMVDDLKGKVNNGVEIASKNEIEFINQVTNKAFHEYEEIKTTMISQIPVIKANLLQQLIEGNITEEKDLKESLEALGINFKFNFFSIILINIDEYFENSLNERNMMKFVVGNIIEYIGNEKYEMHMVDIKSDRVAILVNLSGMDEENMTRLLNLGHTVLDFMKEKLNTVITVALGNIIEGIDKINISYYQALKTIEGQLLRANGKVVKFSDIAKNEKVYSYPIEIELLLINSVKMGNIDKVVQILNEVFEENFENVNISIEMFRCLFFDIMSTAIKVISNLGVNYERIFGNEFRPYESIVACKNILEMQAVLRAIYGEICKYINDNKKSKNQVLIENIMEYIKTFFRNPGLSLVCVADAFDINPNYLSGYFKEQTGENFMNFVNSVRLNEAKRLLQDTKLPLQDICREVGYSNSGVLIRNFKKYEGITPGEYREKIN
jgi:two-component system response regulator YesN